MIKDIAVHLTGSEEDEVRLAHAVQLARTFGAHLTGLHLHLWPEYLLSREGVHSTEMPGMMEQSRRLGETNHLRLKERFAGFDIAHSLEYIETFPSTSGRVLVEHCRTFDLFVGTRPYGDPGGNEHIEEQVLFGSGRACIFVPPRLPEPRPLGRIFVAWKNSRESARALAHALPLLERAESVVVALAGEQDARNGELQPADGILRHLERHGIKAERRLVGEGNPGELLLGEARRLAADLIVMGGYGNSRMREWLLGGVTRHVLSESDIPVLIAH